MRSRVANSIVLGLPWAAALVVWLSPLAFVPIPWPDDSAFYLAGRDLLAWPPRWAMTPFAPFEPTYGLWNFVTMPLFPILLAAGRLLGIDGEHLLKLWPLGAWAASGTLLAWVMLRSGAPLWASLGVVLTFCLHPMLRWASTVVRPESLVGLFAMVLVLGLGRGFPPRWRTRRLLDPVAALTAAAAYAHFNAIHLVVPIVVAEARRPARLLRIGALTALYLSPWLATVAWHWSIFTRQMTLQWQRLAGPNDWLSSPAQALGKLYPALGSPMPWPAALGATAPLLWLLILAAAVCTARAWLALVRRERRAPSAGLAPAAAWVVGAAGLWQWKPEMWFVYFLHLALIAFLGVAVIDRRTTWLAGGAAWTLAAFFLVADVRQMQQLAAEPSWRWDVYGAFVDCIDRQLGGRASERAAPYHVWVPAVPDVTIELARRHPDWEFTRLNDFTNLPAEIRHGRETDVVVLTGIKGVPGERVDAAFTPFLTIPFWPRHPPPFLPQLDREPTWKPRRWACGEGRWTALLFSD